MPSHLSSSGSGGGGSSTLPTASGTVLGGVKVGTGLSIGASGVLSAAFVKLDEVVCASAQPTIPFSSISASYRTLQLILQARGTAAAGSVGCAVQFNGDSGATYDGLEVYAYNPALGTTDAYAQSAATIADIAAASAPADAASAVVVFVPNYSGTTFDKCLIAGSELLSSVGAGGYVWEERAARWRSTAAISSITLSCASGSFAAGSVASLYALA